MHNFEDIYNEHIDTIYKISLLYLKKPYDAEEATQDVFLKYLKYLPNFESKEHAKRWFIKTTTNICKNILKSSWFKKIIYLDIIPESPYNENEDNMLQEIQSLSNKYKDVIYLYYYEGYNTDEIASILNMNASTVRTNLSRARKILKVNLEGDINE